MENEIMNKLAVIEAKVNRLDRTINGNGQPGLAQKIENEITERYRLVDKIGSITEDFNNHIAFHDTNKQDWKWLLALLCAIAAAVASWIKQKGNSKMKKCGEKTEVYSRVCGYFRPVSNWNKGKQEEFKERKLFKIAK